mgnify:CR=1 FL=1|jgi:hypothetical protein
MFQVDKPPALLNPPPLTAISAGCSKTAFSQAHHAGQSLCSLRKLGVLLGSDDLQGIRFIGSTALSLRSGQIWYGSRTGLVGSMRSLIHFTQ